MLARCVRWRDDLTGASSRWGRTILLAALCSKLSMVLTGVAIETLAGASSAQGFSGVLDDLSAVNILVAIFVAPLLESLCVLALVWLVGGLMRRPARQTALIVGLVAVPAHGLAMASLSIFPMFVLFGLIQHNWLKRGGVWTGFWINVAIHALFNGASVLVVAL